MIFLCFNIKDREKIAEPILQHLRSFGFSVWYDRKDIFIGDNRYETNIVNGAGNAKIEYAVVILSNNFSSGHFCIEELNLLRKRFKNNDIKIFPIFYDMNIDNIDSDYQWLLELVCKFVKSKDESIFAAYHIVAKITNDLLLKEKYTKISQFIRQSKNSFLKDMILCYESIDMYNYNARMSALYYIYLYIKEHNNIHQLCAYYYKSFEKLFSFTKLNIDTDRREIQILENVLLLLLSKYY